MTSQILDSTETWVDNTLDQLSIDGLIAQMLNPLLTCPWEATPTTEERLEEAIRYQVGSAFVCSDRADDELKKLIEDFRENSAVPPLINADIETSSVLKETIRLGASMNLGAIRDRKYAEKLAYQCGCYNAAYARTIGINWALGPAIDLPLKYSNPMCGSRNYSVSPEVTAGLSGELIRGMQENGLAACLKHFPGDGTDDRDQHLVTPVNDLDFDQWQETYGKVFASGIANGAHSIMIGHIALLARSARNPLTGTLLPATLDSNIQIDLLRKEMGFNGVIISDAIPMGGAVSHCRDLNDAIVQNIASGSDMVLFVKDIGETIDAVKAAMLQGIITESRLRDSVRRILTMKAKLGLHDNSFTGLTVDEKINEDVKADSVAREVAEKSMTLVRDARNDIPLKLEQGAKIVMCLLPKEPEAGGGMLLPDQVAKAFDSIVLDIEFTKRGYRVACVANQEDLKRESADADSVFFISQTSPEAGRGSIALSRGAHSILKFNWDLINSDIPVLFISMGNPYVLREMPNLPNFICSYTQSPHIANALAKAIMGDIEFAGNLPVEVPLFI